MIIFSLASKAAKFLNLPNAAGAIPQCGNWRIFFLSDFTWNWFWQTVSFRIEGHWTKTIWIDNLIPRKIWKTENSWISTLCVPLQASSSFKWYFFKGGIKFLLLKYMHCMGNPSLWKHFHKVYAKKFFWEILFIRLLLSLAFPRKWIHFSQFLLTWSSECNWMIFKSNYQSFLNAWFYIEMHSYL